MQLESSLSNDTERVKNETGFVCGNNWKKTGEPVERDSEETKITDSRKKDKNTWEWRY